ncbi:aflatoxin B1-aldehyde reductase [Coprinopsis sp. MPI-PUGE-AT-0042]|nr:aflatoxin B1-aldehyde reductase [Coprinopsis sp. MPI-PUGE-AT-0042]
MDERHRAARAGAPDYRRACAVTITVDHNLPTYTHPSTTTTTANMTFSSRIPVIYGAGGIGNPGTFCKLTSAEAAQPIIDGLVILSEMNLHGSVIDTKDIEVYPLAPGDHAPEKLTKAIDAAYEKLGSKIRVFYLHAPDRTVDWTEMCRAINEAHKAGKFERFGLSNYLGYEIGEIVTICRTNGWVAPTAYEGIYNPIDRTLETELIPCLRRYNIGLAAYSPLAGGLLTGHLITEKDELEKAEEGSHYDPKQPFGQFFNVRYGHMIPALRKLKQQVEAAGLNLNQASVRWMQHHSAMIPSDLGIIFGGSKASHVSTTLNYW